MALKGYYCTYHWAFHYKFSASSTIGTSYLARCWKRSNCGVAQLYEESIKMENFRSREAYLILPASVAAGLVEYTGLRIFAEDLQQSSNGYDSSQGKLYFSWLEKISTSF